MEPKDTVEYKNMFVSILTVYTFNADIRKYIDDQIPIFRNRMMGIAEKQILFRNANTDDRSWTMSLNIDMIMDALFENEDAPYILDLVYYEISHYYCG